MGPIDPELFLKTLGPLLNNTGGLKGPTEAKRMASLVSDPSKHVAKCMYMQILNATTDPTSLKMFVTMGGWDTLHGWLQEMRDEENSPLLMELLKVYQKLPVTIDLLKQNNAPKTIKQLSKTEDTKLKELSSAIVDDWMQKIRAKGSSGETEGKSKKKKSSKDLREKDRSEKEKGEKEKEKGEKEKGDKDRESKPKDKHKTSPHHHHHHHHNNKDRDVSSDVSLEDARDKSDSNVSEDSTSSRSIPDNNSRRPKTVKKFGSKFRSTGLVEEQILPVKKKTNEPLTAKPRRVMPDTKSEEPVEKRPRLMLSMSTLIKNASALPPPSPSAAPAPSPSTPSPTMPSPTNPSPSPTEIHRGIKLIPPKKPPAHEFQESSGFMDSLTRTATYGQVKRKRKLQAAANKTAPISLTSSTSATINATTSNNTTTTTTIPHSAPLRLHQAPSFYRDTLETSDDVEVKKEEVSSASNGKETTNREGSTEEPMDTANGETAVKTEVKKEGQENVTEEANASMDGEGTEAGSRGLLSSGSMRRRKAKKRVTWADDAYIREVFYFEMDETERVNVNRLKDFNQMKKEEQLNDRKTLESAKRLVNDNMQEVIPWRRPTPFVGDSLPVQRGSESKEKLIQQEREKGVLLAIFFSKDMLPDSPMEPELEEVEHEEPKIIPLEDENASCEEFSYTYDETYKQNSLQTANVAPDLADTGFSLPPDLASLLAEYQPPQPMMHPQQHPHPNFGQQGLPPPSQPAPQTANDPSNFSFEQAQHLYNMLMSRRLGISEEQHQDLAEKLEQVLKPYYQQNPGLMQTAFPPEMPPAQNFQTVRAPTPGLLGNAPPGYQPLRPMGPGGPVGPSGPRFPFPGGLEGGDDWGENMVGGPQGRGGLGRPGFPMRPRGPPPHMMRGRGGLRPRGMGGRAVCRHFAANGACRFGNSCNFLHPGVNGPLQ